MQVAGHSQCTPTMTEAVSSTHNSMYNRENSMEAQEILTKHIIKRIIDDSANYLEIIGDEQSSTEIRGFFADLINKRKTEVEKTIHTEKSPLQQREEELSSLESEEKNISEAEALIEQQKEGQNIGE